MLDASVGEIEIPVPWGHVAAKVWGDDKDTAVLVFHGIMDNAGSFDHLIPLLPKSFYYICIDLPGHGLSSHFPAHLPLYTLNYLIVYKLIAEYFKRTSYIIMGHSYGGQIGTVFAQLYPQYVEKLILLDTITLFPQKREDFRKYLIEKFDTHLLLEEKLSKSNSPPAYAFEEALEKIQYGRFSPITTEAALALSHRAVKRTEDGRYTFRLDQRTKNFINPLRDFRIAMESFKEDPIKCPVLIVLGRDSKAQLWLMRPMLNYFKKVRNITIKMVKGDHDVHNNSPELVAPFVSTFLLKRKGKL